MLKVEEMEKHAEEERRVTNDEKAALQKHAQEALHAVQVRISLSRYDT